MKKTCIGFTLIEFMMTLLIISIFLMAVQTPITQFHQIVIQGQWQSTKQMDLDRVQMIIKGELFQSGYGVSPEKRHETMVITSDSLIFKFDWNQDGDFSDIRESIAYRFDAEQRILFKKSGSGGFQPLLEDIEAMTFEPIQIPDDSAFQQGCLAIQSQVLASASPITTTLCPLFL